MILCIYSYCISSIPVWRHIFCWIPLWLAWETETEKRRLWERGGGGGVKTRVVDQVGFSAAAAFLSFFPLLPIDKLEMKVSFEQLPPWELTLSATTTTNPFNK